MIKLIIYYTLFIVTGLIINWYWFPEYLLLGVFIASSIVMITWFIISVKNTIEEADALASKSSE